MRIRLLIILFLFLISGCASYKKHIRIYDHFISGMTYEDVRQQINKEFDNIYKILNKD